MSEMSWCRGINEGGKKMGNEKKTNEDKTIFPTADYEITAEDNLMVIAPNKEIEKMGWM